MAAIASSDTIFALSSGMGRSAVAVVRLSGPHVRFALETICGRVPEPRRAELRTLRDPPSGEPIDSGLVLFFPAPASFTGEDCGELQVHGGRAVVAAVLRALGRLPGMRPAEAGEFARRAFLSGKLDLPAVEGLADLIDAETEGQRRQALRQARGGLGRAIVAWREELIDALAMLEASIDFADEGDVGDRLAEDLSAPVRRVAAEISASLAGAPRGERLRDGFRVVIAGAPNAGKSTLLNALARRDVAIVSPVAGTTRDVLEVHLDLAGWPVVLVDTAGLREVEDVVEAEGVRRARLAVEDADLVLWLRAIDSDSEWTSGHDDRVVRVTTKIDVAGSADRWRELHPDVAISAATGQGLDDLLAMIAACADDLFQGEPALVAHERQRVSLSRSVEHVQQALGLFGSSPELAAEQLRLALRELGRVAGMVDVEDVLGRIFSRFCIGK